MARVVILGAGLTGLSVAYHLEKENFSDYVIFEQHERSGGLLRSFKQDGFTFDFTGHLLHSSNEYFSDFLNTVVGTDNLLQVTRRAAIYSHNTYTDYPFQMNLRNLPFDVMYECIEGFIQRVKRRTAPKSFYDWVLNYFGAGFGKHFFFPYNSKLLAYNLKKITPSWTGRFVPQTSLKAILQGSLHDPMRNVGYNSSFLYPKSGGIEFLIKKIESQINNKTKLNHVAERIDTKNKVVFFQNGHQEPYDTLITTMPLDCLLKQLKTPANLSFDTAKDKLLCNAVVNINLGFNKENIHDKHWLYFPEKQYPFYRLGFWHNINPSSVKAGHSALYGELSYLPTAKTKKISEKNITIAIERALDFLHLERKNIVTEKILHLDHAYVIYDQWRENHLDQLLQNLKQEHIFSIGRFGAWKYSSMQEALLDGKVTAQEVLVIANRRAVPKVTSVVSYTPQKEEKKGRLSTV